MSKIIMSLVERAEDDFLNGIITVEQFLKNLDTYAYGKGWNTLPRAWTSETWRNKRILILKESENSDGQCHCKKCGILIKESPVIQHHKHPRKLKDIKEEEESRIVDILAVESYKRNSHKYTYNHNTCISCGSWVKYLRYTKKWECSSCDTKYNPRLGRNVSKTNVYGKCNTERRPISFTSFKKKFINSLKIEAQDRALDSSVRILVTESKAYRTLDGSIFPWSIYCRDCAYNEDLASGKIKKRKKLEVFDENKFKPKAKIRKKK